VAITNYGQLKTAVASWLARSDLTTVIPDFVFLAHKQLQRDLRGHLRSQKRDDAFSVAAEYVPVPSDFLELVHMHRNDSPYSVIQYMSQDEQSTYFDATGGPKFVSITGDTTPGAEYFRFAPAPDGTYTVTLEYYASLPFFTSDNATNWVLNDAPDAYLYGALLQARGFLSDDGRIGLWFEAYKRTVSDIRMHGNRTRWGGPGLMMRGG